MKKKLKERSSQLSLWLVTALFLCLLFPSNAYAYLDPGSGSYILQLIVAGLLTISLTLKVFWRKTWSWFRSLFSKNTDDKSK